MTKSPKRICRDKIQQVYADTNCDARLADRDTEILDSKKYDRKDSALSGVVEWRCERRISRDGTCILLADIFVHDDGIEQTVIVVLEVDGQEYFPIYEEPHPIGEAL